MERLLAHARETGLGYFFPENIVGVEHGYANANPFLSITFQYPHRGATPVERDNLRLESLARQLTELFSPSPLAGSGRQQPSPSPRELYRQITEGIIESHDERRNVIHTDEHGNTLAIIVRPAKSLVTIALLNPGGTMHERNQAAARVLEGTGLNRTEPSYREVFDIGSRINPHE